jgi:hypothetical protein
MTTRPSVDEEGVGRRGDTSNHENNGPIPPRSIPERSRTMSNSELRERGSSTSGLQYAATTPNGSAPTGGSGTSNLPYRAGAYATSRSEDGHSTSLRAAIQDPALPPPPSLSGSACASCGKVVTGQFVRALGVVFHKACFTCNVSTRWRYGD